MLKKDVDRLYIHLLRFPMRSQTFFAPDLGSLQKRIQIHLRHMICPCTYPE